MCTSSVESVILIVYRYDLLIRIDLKWRQKLIGFGIYLLFFLKKNENTKPNPFMRFFFLNPPFLFIFFIREQSGIYD